MAEALYPRERTGLLLVDPCNDFLSEGGKIYPRLKAVANEVGLLDNLCRMHRAVPNLTTSEVIAALPQP